MTTPATRDKGLRRISNLTTWLGVSAVAVTGTFVGLAAHTSHTATATVNSSSAGSSGASATAASGLDAGQAPTASALPSQVRSGAS